MKKTLSILLIVTMLLSMCVVALPTFAATETVDNSKTPGHADYDHVTVEEFATALGIETSAVTVITNYEEYKAITGGADADNIKYYLVDLSADANETLELTTNAHLQKGDIANVYIDFNGYSVDVSGDNNAAFGSLTNATVKNLKLVGNRRYVSANGGYGSRLNEVGMSPLTSQGYGNATEPAKAANGVIHLDNIISSCVTKIHQQHGGGDKFAGGLVATAAAGSTFNKCVFDGSITIENDTATMNANSAVLAVKIGAVGGILGRALGAVTFTNCINRGPISVAYTISGPYNGDGYFGDVALGGMVGSAAAATTFTNCVNESTGVVGNVTSSPNFNFKYAGGMAGWVGGNLTMTDCKNHASFANNDRTAGLAADVAGDIIATRCENTGDFIVNATTVTSTIWTYQGNANWGGIVGRARKTSTFVDCVNRGDIDASMLGITGDSAGENAALGGIVGKANGETRLEGCSNYGDLTASTLTAAGDQWKHVGGLVGRSEVIAYIGYDVTDTTKAGKPCYNEGDITVNSYAHIDHAQPTGGIIGSAWHGAKINGATNKGNITVCGASTKNAQSGAGGIAGALGNINCLSVIENCVNDGDVIYAGSANTTTGLGGMIGRIGDGGSKALTIRNSINNGKIANGAWTGGIVGLNSDSILTISNSKNFGEVTSAKAPGCTDATLNQTFVGGLVGFDRQQLTVTDSANYGPVSITYNSPSGKIHYMGGIVGYTTGATKLEGVVNAGELLASGSSATAGYIGGLVGWANGKLTVADSTNDAKITATAQKYHIGGIAGTVRATDFDNVVNTSNGDIYAYVNDSDMIGIGGIIGYQGGWNTNNKFDYYRCSNLGDIIVTGNGKNACLGGIIGRICGDYGTIANSANAGNIKINLTVGNDNGSAGIIGLYQRVTSAHTTEIVNCVNIGEINGKYTAGVVGQSCYNEADKKLTVNVNNCISSGALNGTVGDKVIANIADTNTTLNATNCNMDATVAEAEIFATSLGLSLTSSMPKALDLAIKGAELLFESDVVYTDASWANFLTALNTVKAYQAATDLRKADPNEVNGYIELLANAKNALVKGADIYTGADFAKLNGQDGVFNLMADITITEGVDSFAGKLNANGHTITVDGCALFGELNGATIENLVIEGTATKALFGKAVGEVAVKYVYVDVEGDFEKAVLFDAADSAAEIEVKAAYVAATSAATAAILAGNCDIELDTVIADVKAPKLTTASDAECDYAYLVGVEAFIDEDAVELADGAVAYAFTKAFVDTNALAAVKVDFASVTLVQIIGVDAFPAVAPFAVDGINVVAPVDASDLSKGYKNAAFRYEDATPVIPVEPIAPVAPIATGLQSSIARAEALVQANYTADTWTALQTALTAAKAALTADTQAAIDSARLALDLALAGLKKAPAAAVTPVNVDALNAAIAAAEALKAGEYTTESWNAVKAAILSAKRAKLGDQATVDAATAALNAAVAALAKQPAPEAPSITKPETTPATEEGCGSVIGGAAVVLTAVIALGAGVSFKKKED